jgi:xanthine dehydrogenase YagR molybdenum-binding subunit
VDTTEIRIRPMLGTFAAGRMFNPKMAHSQLIGGMIWGISGALLEEAVLDRRLGQFVTKDLAGDHVAVNADVPDIEAIILDEADEEADVFGTKGVGEVGIAGAGAAVANAIFNATGVRACSFPVTLYKLVAALP